jgi:hypothetical protein
MPNFRTAQEPPKRTTEMNNLLKKHGASGAQLTLPIVPCARPVDPKSGKSLPPVSGH